MRKERHVSGTVNDKGFIYLVIMFIELILTTLVCLNLH